MFNFLQHFLNSNKHMNQTAFSFLKYFSKSNRGSLIKINNFFPTIHLLHLLALIFICCMIPIRVSCFDYSVQTMPISKQKQSSVNYYVNYYLDQFKMGVPSIQNPHWFSLKQDVVRIKLGSSNGIVNVYKGQITEILEEESFKGTESVNEMCDIVKVFNSEQGFNKYLINHHINKSQSQNKQQYFLSTAHMSWKEITKYNQPMIQQMNNLFNGSDGPLLRIYQQKLEKIILYSITNDLRIHQISIIMKSGDFYKHSPEVNGSPSMMILEDQRLVTSNTTTTIYSLNVSEISFELQQCSMISQSLLNKYKPDNNKYIELIQIENNLIMKCISEQIQSDGAGKVNVGLFLVQLTQNDEGHTWNMKKQSSVDINVQIPAQNIPYVDSIYDSIEVKVLQSSSKQQNDIVYIKTLNKVFIVEMQNKKLKLKELTPIIKNSTKLQFVTMIPIRMKNAVRKHNYFWLAQKNYGLLLVKYQNINASQIIVSIQLTQNFNNTLKIDHIQSLSYAPYSNIKIPLDQSQNQNSELAVLQVIVLTGLNKNKQYVIQLFHEIRSSDGDKLAHLLHLNKIYHNYNVNTNKGYYFSDRFADPETLHQQKYQQEDGQEQESQSSFINKIENIIFPQTQSNITNNVGIIQTQHKITYFQYGVPRTISPQVSVASENLKQDNFGNIADVNYIRTDNRNMKAIETKSLSQSEVQAKIIQYSFNQKDLSTYLIRSPIDENELQRIVLTLDTYLVVLQVNPRSLYHYEYVCNLNSMGVVNEKHKILNDVAIDLSETCENSDELQKESHELVYCEERQIIKFFVNYQTIQEQKDYFMHFLFFVIFIVLFLANLIVVVVFWKTIKKEAEKLLQIRRRKKQKTVFHLSNGGKEEPKNMIEE